MKQASSRSPQLPQLNAEFVLQALCNRADLQATQSGAFTGSFTSVTTDSRKVPKGSLFVALRGETFDGHQFIDRALEAGAAGAICETGTEIKTPGAIFRVKDSLAGYRALAHAWRKGFEIPLVGIAGSNGKTTTKELLSAILSGRYGKVLKTTGSQNGFVGIPMTLLELTPGHRAAVIEIGIDEIGAMAQHMDLVEPKAALLTSIGPEHLEKLRDVPTVAREESIALERVSDAGGTVAVHLDDPYIQPLWKKLSRGKKIGYTLGDAHPEGDICRGRLSSDGRTLAISGPGLSLELELPLLGKHNAMNLLGAVTLAHALGLSADEIRRGLSTFQGAEGRSQVRELKGGTLVLCDYYNASPPSVAAGIELLNDLASHPKSRRRFVCLADMRELGPDEERFHRELAKPILKSGIENVLLFGKLMGTLEDELKKGGFQGETLKHFSSRPELSQALVAAARAGDAIMIKGSHSMKMEEVFHALEASLK